ncbi:MAG TPA: hypothetical protein VJ935_06855 [Acidimicrobiia bacterium]|nr:hypothetical protein [Acidimicrobiia bacterium]
MSSFAAEQYGFGAAMRDSGTALSIAATGTFNGVLGLLRYETEGDPFGSGRRRRCCGHQERWPDMGYFDGRDGARPTEEKPGIVWLRPPA